MYEKAKVFDFSFEISYLTINCRGATYWNWTGSNLLDILSIVSEYIVDESKHIHNIRVKS